MGSFSILPIGTYAASTNFHQLRDTTAACCRWVINEGLDDDELALQQKARIAPVFPFDNAPGAQYERDLFYEKLKDLGDLLELVNWGELTKAVRALAI